MQWDNSQVTNLTNPSLQAQYQVRLDWGTIGANRLRTDADIVLWVDALKTAPMPRDLGISVTCDVNNRTAVAAWVLSEQVRRGQRTSIALIAAGLPDGGFAVEDFLAAGALVDALAAVGIDFCSPEAASAAAAFTGLSGAVGHLITASVTGRQLVADGKRELVVAAGKIDSVHTVNPAYGKDP